jgi:hypothetical protein
MLGENDYISILDQFPIQSLFAYVFRVSSNHTPLPAGRGWRASHPNEDHSLHSFLELIAFCNRFMSLFASAFGDESRSRHRHFMLRIGKYMAEVMSRLRHPLWFPQPNCHRDLVPCCFFSVLTTLLRTGYVFAKSTRVEITFFPEKDRFPVFKWSSTISLCGQCRALLQVSTRPGRRWTGIARLTRSMSPCVYRTSCGCLQIYFSAPL